MIIATYRVSSKFIRLNSQHRTWSVAIGLHDCWLCDVCIITAFQTNDPHMETQLSLLQVRPYGKTKTKASRYKTTVGSRRWCWWQWMLRIWSISNGPFWRMRRSSFRDMSSPTTTMQNSQSYYINRWARKVKYGVDTVTPLQGRQSTEYLRLQNELIVCLPFMLTVHVIVAVCNRCVANH